MDADGQVSSYASWSEVGHDSNFLYESNLRFVRQFLKTEGSSRSEASIEVELHAQDFDADA